MANRQTISERLEERVLDALKDRFGPDAKVSIVHLAGVTGYWRIADVRRWEGEVIVDGRRHWVGSWETMTTCARLGVTLVHHSDPNVHRPDWYGFDAWAKEGK